MRTKEAQRAAEIADEQRWVRLRERMRRWVRRRVAPQAGEEIVAVVPHRGDQMQRALRVILRAHATGTLRDVMLWEAVAPGGRWTLEVFEVAEAAHLALLRELVQSMAGWETTMPKVLVRKGKGI